MTVGRRGDRAHYSGLQTCGSIWSCPCCSAKIQAERSAELGRAVERAYDLGLNVAMATLTMRHRQGQSLSQLWDALADAFKAAMGRDRAVKRAKAGLGVVGWVRRVEATHGDNGWHVHAHVLLFYRDDRKLDELWAAMWRGWVRRLGAHGLDADPDHGLDLRRIDLAQAREELARYLNKSTYESTSSQAIARELAGQIGKTGKHGNRAPFDVLADLVANGAAEDLSIWREWEQGSKNRRAMAWSKGLRDELLPGDVERTDEELAEDNDGGQVDVAVIHCETWRSIVRLRLEVDVLEVAEAVDVTDVYDALSVAFERWGIPPPLHPPLRDEA